MQEIAQGGKRPASKLSFSIKERSNNDEIRGKYLPPCLVHHVTEWANLKYAIQVAKIMDILMLLRFGVIIIKDLKI
jgi:hypothetical protein